MDRISEGVKNSESGNHWSQKALEDNRQKIRTFRNQKFKIYTGKSTVG